MSAEYRGDRTQKRNTAGDRTKKRREYPPKQDSAKTQERQTRFNMATDMWAKFMTLGADYLNRVYKDMERLNLLSGADRDSVRICAISVSRGNLTDRQVKRLVQIFQRLEQETDYIIPEK